MKHPEYIEGPEAFANFERFASEILQAKPPKKKRPKSATGKKPKKSDRD
jgi:hypothetical protein